MRVVHLDHSRGWRGGQTQLLHLLEGKPSHVICRRRSELSVRLTARKFIHQTHDDWLTPFGIHRLSKRIASLGVQCVVAHTSTAHGAALRATSLPVVVHRRVDFAPSRLSRRKYARATGFVAVSDAVARVLSAHGVSSRRIVTVCDGVDTSAIEQATPARDPLDWVADPSIPTLLAVGALVGHKDHATLLEALAMVPKARLIIAGTGPLRRPLERQAERGNISGRVQFVGHYEDIFGLLKSATVFVHPSKLEGRGQAVLEAMVAGIPVVATRAGGVPETLGDAGLLVKPGCATELALAIQRVVRKPAFFRRSARDAQNRIREQANLTSYRANTWAAYRHFVSEATHNG